MSDTSQLQPLSVSMSGGLVKNKDAFTQDPSTATSLINLEPSIDGGYRRINGYAKFHADVVPGAGVVLGVGGFAGEVIACRGDNVYASNGVAAWSLITSARTGAEFYTFTKFFWAAEDVIIMTDNINPAGRWNGSVYSTINHANAPTTPNLCAEFNNSLVLTEENQLYVSAPNAENDFNPANGAAQFALPAPITAIRKFRQSLYIFGERYIRKLTGYGLSSYNMDSVTDSTGCIASRSVQEVGGDLIFLASDGLRTIAGTTKIDDVELGSVSRNIQSLLGNSAIPAANTNYVCSAVIRDKSQYRLFIPINGATQEDSLGVIAVITSNGIEFSTMQGIRPACADDIILGDTTYIVVHGGFDGYVYRQDVGKYFDNAIIPFEYTTAEILFEDPGLRNEVQRLILNIDQEGKTRFNMHLKYNFDDADSPQPSPYPINLGSLLTTYGEAIYDDSESMYADKPEGLIRQPVEGSGFSVSLTFTQDDAALLVDSSDSFTVKGIQFEQVTAGRR